jgi:hypothetical protein
MELIEAREGSSKRQIWRVYIYIYSRLRLVVRYGLRKMMEMKKTEQSE